jgi:hypothetical protein
MSNLCKPYPNIDLKNDRENQRALAQLALYLGARIPRLPPLSRSRSWHFTWSIFSATISFSKTWIWFGIRTHSSCSKTNDLNSLTSCLSMKEIDMPFSNLTLRAQISSVFATRSLVTVCQSWLSILDIRFEVEGDQPVLTVNATSPEESSLTGLRSKILKTHKFPYGRIFLPENRAVWPIDKTIQPCCM